MEAEAVLGNPDVMAGLMTEFERLRREAPEDFNFDQWIQERLKGLSREGKIPEATRPQKQLRFGVAQPLRSVASPNAQRGAYAVRNYTDTDTVESGLHIHSIDARPPNQLQLSHAGGLRELKGYKPSVFKPQRPHLIGGKENKGQGLSIAGEGPPEVDGREESSGVVRGSDGHLYVVRQQEQHAERHPTDREPRDTFWSQAQPSAYAQPQGQEGIDRLTPRDSKGRPLHKPARQPWVSAAQLQQSLAKSEQVRPKVVAAEQERRMAMATALARQAVALGLNPSGLAPRRVKPAAPQTRASACVFDNDAHKGRDRAAAMAPQAVGPSPEPAVMAAPITTARGPPGLVGQQVQDYEDRIGREQQDVQDWHRDPDTPPMRTGGEATAVEVSLSDIPAADIPEPKGSDADPEAELGGASGVHIDVSAGEAEAHVSPQPTHIGEPQVDSNTERAMQQAIVGQRLNESVQRAQAGALCAEPPHGQTAKNCAAASKQATVNAAVDAMMSALTASGAASGLTGPDALVQMMMGLAKQQALSELGAPSAALLGKALQQRASGVHAAGPSSATRHSESKGDQALVGHLHQRTAINWPSSLSDTDSVASTDNSFDFDRPKRQPQLQASDSARESTGRPRGHPRQSRVPVNHHLRRTPSGPGGRGRTGAHQGAAGRGRGRGPSGLPPWALEKRLAAAIAADFEQSRGPSVSVSSGKPESSSGPSQEQWSKMSAMEDRLSRLVNSLDTKLDRLEGQASHYGAPAVIEGDELTQCLQTLSQMEATELEIRSRWLSGAATPPGALRMSDVWETEGDGDDSRVQILAPCRTPPSATMARLALKAKAATPTYKSPVAQVCSATPTPAAPAGPADSDSDEEKDPMPLTRRPPMPTPHSQPRPQLLELLPDRALASIKEGRKAYLRRQKMLQGDLIAQSEPEFSIVKVVESVANLLVEDILADNAQEMASVFDSFAEHMFQSEFSSA